MARRERTSTTFKAGAVCLAFFIVGYQASVFARRSAELCVQAKMDSPDTVFVYVTPKIVNAPQAPDTQVVRRSAPHTEAVARVRRQLRKVQTFDFDPNTASAEDFELLGFSPKQAQALLNYRDKGGRWHRPGDFAKSYVVADSVYERLAPHIRIPKLDINTADSAAFDALPGIGRYFAARMVQYRESLGGYSHGEQLMEIYNFTRERFDAIRDLIECSPAEPYPLWTLPEQELGKHPYVRRSARGIVFYREHNPKDKWTVQGLLDAGVINEEAAAALSRIRLVEVAGGD